MYDALQPTIAIVVVQTAYLAEQALYRLRVQQRVAHDLSSMLDLSRDLPGHGQGNPGDVRGLVGGQKQYGGGFFFRRAEAFHQSGRNGPLHDLAQPSLVVLGRLSRISGNAAWRRFYAARRNTANPYAVLRVFESEAGGN